MTRMSHAFFGPLKGRESRIPRSGDALIEECRMPFIRPLKGERKPHTPFRRHSRPFGQAYAPSEVSGILFLNNIQNKRQDDILFKIRKTQSGVLFFINLKVWLWFSSEVTWMAISWIVNTEPGFIGSRWIREE